MKSILKKIFKTLFIFIISSIIIYLVSTILAFYGWCVENQISIFNHSDDLLSYLDSDKIKKLGDTVGNYANLLEDALNEEYYEADENYHAIAEYYDPLGFSIWAYLQMSLGLALSKNIAISILSGIAIAIAYLVISSKKMNNALKIVIGYLGVMLLVPIMLEFSITHNFNFVSLQNLFDIYYKYNPNLIYFYIGYTAIFVLMYFINYRVGVKMAKELNQTIKGTKNE